MWDKSLIMAASIVLVLNADDGTLTLDGWRTRRGGETAADPSLGELVDPPVIFPTTEIP
jgi:hypothetical protein